MCTLVFIFWLGQNGLNVIQFSWWEEEYLYGWDLNIKSGVRITNDSITIQFQFPFALLKIVILWSLQNFDMTAVESWYVQNLVAIWWPVIELQQYKFPTKFKLWSQVVSEMASRPHFSIEIQYNLDTITGKFWGVCWQLIRARLNIPRF